MAGGWSIRDNVLTYEYDGKTTVYDASVLYSVMIEGTETEVFSKEEISGQLPELRFSKISSPVTGYFDLDKDQIKFELRVSRRGKIICIPAGEDVPDHYVAENS